MIKRWFVLIGLLFLLSPVSVAADAVVPARPTTAPIVDQAGILTPEQVQTIAARITAEQAATGNQIGVLTIKSLNGSVLEDYSLKVARSWGIGSKDRNNGVLLLVAVNDRKVRIEVGYGLEGALPDIKANHIIEDRIRPAFRSGSYYDGINSGVDGIMLAIHNEVDPMLSTHKTAPKSGGFLEFIFFALFIIPGWLGSILGRSKSWWAGGVLGAVIAGVVVLIIGLTTIGILMLVILPIAGLLFDKLVSSNYSQRKANGLSPSWWAGGGSFGGGGGDSGGFGGFGGGGFGGGGSSGSW